MVDADQVAVLCTKYVHMNTIMDDADGLMVVRQETKMAYLSENKNKYFGKILSQEVCQLYFLTQERNHLPHTYKRILSSMLVPKCNCW